MKLFLRCLDIFEAQHKANLLRSAGIRVEVRNTFLSGAVGDIPFIEAGPQIWIDERESAEMARTIIREAEQAPPGPEWVCECCGEAIEGQFAQCWNCGSARPFES
ncbi:MAG TPA: DUF2007 domain-containing protein [Azoarcus taiwanensis]|uniref:DUF2007 domain-containing protein n=1 Tax=Azoarcus taiwanensis TaxID=666964 RepID=A0A972JBC5_9RHOO|nr:hypothetical protein [Azoarcus taiwanensis]HRQ58780.1 DUF2007 domain-containing protein [Azoarcus taiwanensis]